MKIEAKEILLVRGRFRTRGRGRGVIRAGLVAVLFATTAHGVLAQEMIQNPFRARVDLLEQQASDLANQLTMLPGQSVPTPPVRIAQNNRAAAQINVRLDALENQMRILNGQVEGLVFQLTQLQTLIANMQQDNEFRFQDLEGGSLGKTEAVTPSGSATLASELPPVPAVENAPLVLVPQTLAPQTQVQDGPGEDEGPFGPEFVFGEGLGENSGTFDFGEQEAPTLDLENSFLTLSPPGGQAFDLSVQSGEVVRDGDAEAQYKAGFEAVTTGDYLFAEEQFRQFIALFPGHPNAANATHWLGESLLQRGEYEEAAEVLLEGFEHYPDAVKAPDMLLKLGVALSKADERETACRTFVEALRRYPNGSNAYRRRIALEQKSAQC